MVYTSITRQRAIEIVTATHPRRATELPARQGGYLLVAVAMVLTVIAVLGLISNRESIIGTKRVSGETETLQAEYVARAGIEHAAWIADQSGCTGYTLAKTSFGAHSYEASFNPTAGSPVMITATGTLSGGGAGTVTRSDAIVYQSPVTSTLYASKDSYITIEDDTSNFGGQKHLFTDSEEKGRGPQRALVQFDLSILPDDIKFNSAEVALYLSANDGSQTDVVEGYRLTRNWLEGNGGGGVGVSWNSYDGTNSWTTPGGDYAPEVAGSFVASGTGWKTMQIDSLVQDWVDGRAANHGLLLLSPPASGNNPKKYSSREAILSLRPQLMLTYACPCGSDCELKQDTTFILSTDSDAELGGLSFLETDLAEYDWSTLTASLFLDSIAAGMPERTDAVHVLEDGHIVLSTDGDTTFGGLSFRKEDLIEYDPVAGTATMFLEADVHFASRKNIISVHVMDNGNVVFSTDASGEIGGLTFSDRDLVEYNRLTGQASIFFDGDATTLSKKITAVHIRDNGQVVLTADGDTTLGGMEFGTDQLIEYDPVEDHAALYFDGETEFSTTSEKIRSLHIGRGSGGAAAPCRADYTANNITYKFTTAGLSQRLNRGITYLPLGQSLKDVAAPVGGAWIAVGDSGILWMLGMDGSVLDNEYDTGLSGLEGIAFIPASLPHDPGHLAIVKDSTLYYVDITLNADESYTTHSLPFVSSAGGITYIDGGTWDGHLALADKDSALIHIIDQSFNLVATLATDGLLSTPEGVAHLENTDKFLVVDTGLGAALIFDTGLAVSQSYALAPYGLGGAPGAAAAIDPISCNHVFGDHPNNRYVYMDNNGSGAGGTTSGTYRDEFNAKTYNGNDGTLTWSTDWFEINETDGPTGGDEKVDKYDGVEFALRIRDNENGGEGVQREADLLNCSSASLSFDFRRKSFDDSNDYVTVDVSADGGNSWTELDRLAGPADEINYQPATYDISAAMATSTRIRFLTSPTQEDGDEFFVDNVEISCP